MKLSSGIEKIPVAVAMGGAIHRGIKHIVEAHCNTFKLATGFRIIRLVAIAIAQIFNPF
jgi:hypothetical protein